MGARVAGERYGLTFPPWKAEQRFFSHEECDSAPSSTGGEYQFSANGAAATVSNIAGLDGRPGLWRHETGTTAAGRAACRTALTSVLMPTAAAALLEQIQSLRFPTLSALAEEYSARVGFIDSITADSANGAWWEYDRLTHGNDNLRMKTGNGGVRTTVDSAIPVVAGTVYRLGVRLVPGLAMFFRDGTLVATIATNLPVATGFGRGSMLLKSAGLTNRTMDVDFYAFIAKGMSR